MSMKVMTRLRTGLKLGPAVVRAMGEGKHSLLLLRVRTGGFKGHFPISDLEFFLIPAGDELESEIRSEFRSFLDGPRDRDGDTVTVRYKAQAVDVAMMMDGSELKAFAPWHIWNEDALQTRLQWDPVDPMFLLTCKVVRLDPPLEIPWKESYEGSDPWIEIDAAELPDAALEPIMEHNDFLKIAVDVKAALAEAQKNPIERPEPPAAAAKPAPPKATAAAPAKPEPPTAGKAAPPAPEKTPPAS
jgi:hypothetical protein